MSSSRGLCRNPCEVVGCEKAQGCLYGWPKNQVQRQRWTEACGVPHNPSRKELIVCSNHFTAGDFKNDVFDGTLKVDAVPNLNLPGPLEEMSAACLKSRLAAAEKELKNREQLIQQATQKVISMAKERDAAKKLANRDSKHIEQEIERGKRAAEEEFEAKLKTMEGRFEAERRAMKEENQSLRDQLKEGGGANTSSDSSSVFVFKGEPPQFSDSARLLEGDKTVPIAEVEKVVDKYKKLVNELKCKLKKCLDDLQKKDSLMRSATQKIIELSGGEGGSRLSVDPDDSPPVAAGGSWAKEEKYWEKKYGASIAEKISLSQELQKAQTALMKLDFKYKAEREEFSKGSKVVKGLKKEVEKLNKKILQLRSAKREATNVSGREKTIDDFLRTKRFTSVQRRVMLSKKKVKKIHEFGDEDCLRAALIKSVSDQALNLLRATEPYPIPSDTILGERLRGKVGYKTRLETRMRMIRDPNCTPADLHREMSEYEPEADPEAVNHDEAVVMKEAEELMEPADFEAVEEELREEEDQDENQTPLKSEHVEYVEEGEMDS